MEEQGNQQFDPEECLRATLTDSCKNIIKIFFFIAFKIVLQVNVLQ